MKPLLRPFREEDREAVTAILNFDLPTERRYTAEEWRAWDAEMAGDEVYERLVAGEPPVAYLEVMDMGTTHIGWRSIAGICEIELSVTPEHRGQGSGSALYTEALRFASERGAHTLRCWFYQTGPDCPMMAFLAKRGFAEHERRQTSWLDLTTLDQAWFADVRERVAAEGVRILRYSDDLPDDLANRQRLYDLKFALDTVTPGESFETWAAVTLGGRSWDEGLLLIAVLHDEWIGLCDIGGFVQGTGIAKQTFTGTLPAYRGRGIATAIKLHAYEIMARRGCRTITTSNRANNLPMLAINRKLGFAPGPIEWTFDKPLL